MNLSLNLRSLLLLLFSTCFSVSSSYAALVGHWPLNETSGTTAADISTGGNPGTLTDETGSSSGTPTFVNDPTRGWVLALDGKGDVQINTAYTNISTQMSLSFWAKGNASLNKGTAFSAMKSPNNQLFTVKLPKKNQEVLFRVDGQDTSYNTSSSNNLKGSWHHWVFKVDAATGAYSIYLDGVQEDSGTLPGAPLSLSNIVKLRIGSLKGDNFFYDGRMSDVRIYNHVLTFQEIQNLFTPQNSPPVAADDSYLVQEDTLRTVTAPGVLGNDSDSNGDSFTAVLDTDVSHGTLSLAADGSFTYTPTTGFTGNDQFTYHANDGTDDSNIATVHLTVQANGAGLLTVAEINQINTAFGITMTNAQELTLAGLVKPTTPLPQWRTDANARIEQHRKADFNIEVTDSAGNLIPNAQVSFSLTKKQFRFGGIMDLKEFSQGASHPDVSITTASYKALFQTLFDYSGLNNGLKPKLRNSNEPLLPAYFTWLDSIGMTSRGHLLMWPGNDHMTATVEAKVVLCEDKQAEIETEEAGNNDPAVIATLTAQLDTLKTDLQTTINAEITEWAGLWDVTEWDVINEVLSNKRVQNILGDSEMIGWFTLAKNNAVNPNVKTLINDYQLISARSTALSANSYTTRKSNYKTQIQQLIDGNAPIDSIGFQSRFGWEHLDPTTIYSRIQDFESYGLPMVGTEFEVKDKDSFAPSEELRAQMTEEVMTTYFSHPLMDGLYAWEYISSTLNTALLNGDGTPKMNGLVWYYLNRIRYQTDTSKTTDIHGTTNFRGFKGTYDVTVTIGGQTFPSTLTMHQNGVYPISINYSGATVLTNTILAQEDAHTQENKPNTNKGNYKKMTLRNAAGFNQVAFLKFNVTGLSTTPDQTTLRISSETLTGTIEAYAVADTSWTESTITFNNQPTLGAKIGEATASAGGTIDIDLGNYVTTNGILTIALKTTLTSGKTIHSSEATDPAMRPRLILTSNDSDNDGIHDGWEITHASDLTTMDAASDLDNDGSSDLSEYLAGTDPSDPTDYFRTISFTQQTGNQYQLTWTSKPGKNYRIMKSTTLQAGSWQPDTGIIIPSSGTTTSATVIVPSSDRVFYRVELP